MKRMRRRFLPGGYKLRVGRSRTGLGLFAEEAIPRGACVIEYFGRRIAPEEEYTSRSKYLFSIGRNTTIDGNVKENVARYINHSCAPNCEVELKDHRVYIFAKRPIKPGEEFSYDYGEEYFNEHIKPKGCRCTKCSPHTSSSV